MNRPMVGQNSELKTIMRRLSWFTLLFAAGGIPTVLVLHADSGKTESNAAQAEVTLTNRLAPSQTDPEIGWVTARLLEQHHFVQHPFDDNFSEKFFERYIEMLDPQKLHFTQGDFNEFAS